MPTSLSTTLEDVRARISEASPIFWQDTDLTNWINEACRDIARRAECLWSLANISVVANTQTYPGPITMIRIHKIEFSPTGTSLTYPVEASNILNMDQIWGIRQNVPSTYPSFYTLWGNTPNVTIKLFPVPAVAGNLAVYYYRIPTPVNNPIDTLDIPEGWQDCVSLYCEYVAKRKDHNPEWKDAKEDYEAKLSDLIGRTYELHDQANFIFTGGGYVPDYIWAGDTW